MERLAESVVDQSSAAAPLAWIGECWTFLRSPHDLSAFFINRL